MALEEVVLGMSGHLPYEELGKVIRGSEMCKVLGREEPGTLELKVSLRGWRWGGGPWQGPVVWAWPVAVRVWVFMPSARGSHGGFEREEWCGPSYNLKEHSGCRGGMRQDQRNQGVTCGQVRGGLALWVALKMGEVGRLEMGFGDRTDPGLGEELNAKGRGVGGDVSFLT